MKDGDLAVGGGFAVDNAVAVSINQSQVLVNELEVYITQSHNVDPLSVNINQSH